MSRNGLTTPAAKSKNSSLCGEIMKLDTFVGNLAITFNTPAILVWNMVRHRSSG